MPAGRRSGAALRHPHARVRRECPGRRSRGPRDRPRGGRRGTHLALPRPRRDTRVHCGLLSRPKDSTSPSTPTRTGAAAPSWPWPRCHDGSTTPISTPWSPRLTDPTVRANVTEGLNPDLLGRITLAHVPAAEWSWAEGLALTEVAERAGRPAADVLLDLLVDTGLAASAVIAQPPTTDRARRCGICYGTRATWVGPTASTSAATRTRAAGVPSPDTSAATFGTSATGRGRRRRFTSPPTRPAGSASPTGGCFGPASPRTWPWWIRCGWRIGPPMRSRGRSPKGSTTSWSTACPYSEPVS